MEGRRGLVVIGVDEQCIVLVEDPSLTKWLG